MQVFGYNLCNIAVDFKVKNKQRTSEVSGIDENKLREILECLHIPIPAEVDEPDFEFFGNSIHDYVVDNCPDGCTVLIP